MPYTTRVIREGTGLVRTWTGEVTPLEMVEAVRNFPSVLPDPGRLTHALMDLSGVNRIRFDMGGLMEILRVTREQEARMQPGYMAIVAEDSLVYGIARMYQGFSQDRTWEVRVFRRLPEAEAWLEGVLGA